MFDSGNRLRRAASLINAKHKAERRVDPDVGSRVSAVAAAAAAIDDAHVFGGVRLFLRRIKTVWNEANDSRYDAPNTRAERGILLIITRSNRREP